MKALLLTWDLRSKPPEVFETLRAYIARESWQRYGGTPGLSHKMWFSNSSDGVFGAFYLWETAEAMEQEIATMYRVERMTGVKPQVQRLDVEAVQRGGSSITDLLSQGLAWTAAKAS
jgi:hypothetical protein